MCMYDPEKEMMVTLTSTEQNSTGDKLFETKSKTTYMYQEGFSVMSQQVKDEFVPADRADDPKSEAFLDCAEKANKYYYNDKKIN